VYALTNLKMTRILLYVAALACLAVLLAPVPASTASGTPSSPTHMSADTGGLPFTWAELGLLAGVGAALVLLGFSLRRITRRSTES